MTNTNKGIIIAAILIILLAKPKKATPLIIVNRMKDYTKYRWYKNIKNLNFINKLHPNFRVSVMNFFSEIEDKLGLQILPTYYLGGYRTYKEQDYLHKKNSSNPKAGYSDHNYGFAFDINIMDKNNKIILKKNSSSKKWRDSGVVGISENLNFKWGGGGNFGNYHDPVHFYIRPSGKTVKDLKILKDNGQVDKNGYVII